MPAGKRGLSGKLSVATEEGAEAAKAEAKGLEAESNVTVSPSKQAKSSTASPKISTPSPSRQPSARLQARAEAGLITDMAAIAAGRGLAAPAPQPQKTSNRDRSGPNGRGSVAGAAAGAKAEPVIDAAQTQAFVFGTTLARGKRVRGAEGADGAEASNKRAKQSAIAAEDPARNPASGLSYQTVGKENRILHTKAMAADSASAAMTSQPQPTVSPPKKVTEVPKQKATDTKKGQVAAPDAKGVDKAGAQAGGKAEKADKEMAEGQSVDKNAAAKMTAEERKKLKLKRQEEVMRAIGTGNVTEKSILDKVGDSRYTREILRRLLAQGIVDRAGKGGSNDPFLYTVVKSMLNAEGKCAVTPNLIDPGLEVRLRRIEGKIMNLLSKETSYTTEKSIRMQVGDNTGTGKALRRLVMSGRVIREGKGGVGDPFRYKCNTDPNPQPLAPPPAQPVVTKVEEASELPFTEDTTEEEPALLANNVQSDSTLIIPFSAGDYNKKRGPIVRREVDDKMEHAEPKPRGAVESFSPKWARKYERKIQQMDQHENSANESMNSSGHLNDSINEKMAGHWYLGAQDAPGDNSLGDLGDSLGMSTVLGDNDDATSVHSVHSSTGSDDLSGPSEIGDSDRSNSPPPHSACSFASSRGRNVVGIKGVEGHQDPDKLLGALFSTDDVADAFLV